MGYITGDGKHFYSMSAAIRHANDVARKTGVLISVEEAK